MKFNAFLLDTFKLASGTIAAQVINVLASLFIARLYNPDAFGEFALFASIMGVFGSISTLAYDSAIILPKRNTDAVNLLAGTFIILAISSLIMLLIVWVGRIRIAEWFNMPALAEYLWLAPIILLFGGVGAGHPVLNIWAVRTRHFSAIAISQIVGMIASMLGKILFGIYGLNTGGGLILGSLIGSITSPFLLGWQIWKHKWQSLLSSVRPSLILKNMGIYKKFPLYTMPANLLYGISLDIPSFLLALYFSPTIVGYYAFGNQILRQPMILISNSISRTFYSHASKAYHNGSFSQVIEDTFQNLVEYALFPILLLGLIGMEICTVVFGVEWAEAGVYIQILSLWSLFWFISTPIASVFNILGKNEIAVRLNIAIIITRVASTMYGGILGNARLAMILLSITGTIVHGIMCISTLYISKVRWRVIGRIVLKNVTLFSLASLIIYLIKLASVPDWIQIIVAGIMFIMYYSYIFKEHILSLPLFQAKI